MVGTCAPTRMRKFVRAMDIWSCYADAAQESRLAANALRLIKLVFGNDNLLIQTGKPDSLDVAVMDASLCLCSPV